MHPIPARSTFLAVVTLALAAALAPAAHATPLGTGVRGSMTVTWGGMGGAPITSWNGTLGLEFDPSAAGRRSIVAASTDPALGEPWRPLFGPQVQAARVTQLVSDKVEMVTCQRDDLSTYEVAWSTSVASLGDPRVSFELLTPRVDLIAGTGSVQLEPYAQSNSSAGDTGWWVNDRLVVPGRWTSAGDYPCPGVTATPDAAARQQRVLAVNGQGAVPLAFYDWLANQPLNEYRLRRTTAGWRLLADATRRATFSESRFGPQDTQQVDLRVRSQLFLAGSLLELRAKCRVPREAIERARSAAAAVALARRAGLTNTTFAGTRRGFGEARTRYVIESPSIDSMGHAPCMQGRYRIWRYAASA